MTHPLEPIGKLAIVGSLIVSAVFGFMANPVIPSILIGSIAFTIGYMLIRTPQMIHLYRDSKNGKFLLSLPIIFFWNCLIPAILYALSRILSKIIS